MAFVRPHGNRKQRGRTNGGPLRERESSAQIQRDRSWLVEHSVLAGSANADPLVTFTYTNLNGSFNAGSSVFNANAVNNALMQTDGSVTRVAGPGAGTAVFNNGFFGTLGAANFQLSLSVTGLNAMLGTANGAGGFIATDAAGSTLTGTLTGTWISFGGATFFNGVISNSVFAGGPVFIGNNGPAFVTNVPGQPLNGSLVQLFLNDPTGGFFSQSFDSVATGVAGQLVPSPASIALIGLSGLIAGRRRR